MELEAYLVVSLVLFLTGIVVMIARKNIIAVLLGVELILNACAINFVAYSKFLSNNIDGHIFSLFIIIVAAAEAAVGLAIVIRFYQIRESIHIDKATLLNDEV